MTSCLFRRLLPGLMLLVLVGPAAAQTPPPAPPSPFVPGPWWRDSRKALLGLTDDQSKRIEAIIQMTMPNARQERDELDAQEAALSQMIMSDVDEAAIARQSDHVETLRAMLNKRRTLMLVRMRAVLTPDQRAKLTKLREQWDREHQPPPRTGNDRDRRPPQQGQDSPKSPR